ncbi:DUF2996 domain-containing protein [Chroococcus sp. FPU101]|uniref:DUF2996 domain-containing protein n=1 Tax=Chroococcus sp. FPU101 TaxID=1974212 RepID=UPI001A8F5140|nr:DUF2996 domain-containing protein [Chroococcus sp. FPU101]GFE70247.1 hypothetical protein CFPU101_28570 [Chroococcus sp. FPU101]
MPEETTRTPDSEISSEVAEVVEAKPEPKAKPAEAAGEKPAAAKKPKAPAIEDKPFTEFIEQHFIPALKEAIAKKGISDVEVSFKKEPLPIAGLSTNEQYWQVKGNLEAGTRQFNLYFFDEDINGKKAFSYAVNGLKPSTLESFMIDEKKAPLDLLLLYTMQRLNAQKWFSGN